MRTEIRNVGKALMEAHRSGNVTDRWFQWPAQFLLDAAGEIFEDYGVLCHEGCGCELEDCSCLNIRFAIDVANDYIATHPTVEWRAEW